MNLEMIIDLLEVLLFVFNSVWSNFKVVTVPAVDY